MHIVKLKNLLLIRPFKISLVVAVFTPILFTIILFIADETPLGELDAFEIIDGGICGLLLLSISILSIPSLILGLPCVNNDCIGFMNINSPLGLILGIIFLCLMVFIISIIISVIFEGLKMVFCTIKQKDFFE